MQWGARGQAGNGKGKPIDVVCIWAASSCMFSMHVCEIKIFAFKFASANVTKEPFVNEIVSWVVFN